jgi:hypothetical protein
VWSACRSSCTRPFDQNDRSVDVSLAYLHRQGIDWFRSSNGRRARREYERVGSLLGQRQIEELIALPLMSEPRIAAVVNVLSGIMTALLLQTHTSRRS